METEVAAVCPRGMDLDLIDADDPPTFFGHGEKDNSALMIEPYIDRFKQVKVYNKIYIAPALGHRIMPIKQIKSDWEVEEMNYIIGRLSDWGIGRKDWDKIRDVQKKLGEAGSWIAWVDNDDLNDDNKSRNGTHLKGSDHLHYSKAGYELPAKRYVEKLKKRVK